VDGRKTTPLFVPALGMASLGVSWVGLLRVINSHGGSASGRASEHPRPAVVLSQGATDMEICCPQISAVGDYCSLSVHSQRQRPCLENGSQCCCACGLSRGASSIGELRRRAGRSMHSSRATAANAFSVRPFHRVCPSGKMQSKLPEW